MGRRHQAHVDRDRLLAADAHDLALLQRAQQLDLQRGVHVADLVEEQRAAVGQLELAARARCTPVATPPSMPNSSLSSSDSGSAAQLSAISGPVRPESEVDELGHQLLAGAALAAHQHADAARRHPLDELEHLPHGGGVGDDAAAARPRSTSASAQRLVLLGQPLALGAQPLDLARAVERSTPARAPPPTRGSGGRPRENDEPASPRASLSSIAR